MVEINNNPFHVYLKHLLLFIITDQLHFVHNGNRIGNNNLTHLPFLSPPDEAPVSPLLFVLMTFLYVMEIVSHCSVAAIYVGLNENNMGRWR